MISAPSPVRPVQQVELLEQMRALSANVDAGARQIYKQWQPSLRRRAFVSGACADTNRRPRRISMRDVAWHPFAAKATAIVHRSFTRRAILETTEARCPRRSWASA
jgi:hypothetical protein